MISCVFFQSDQLNTQKVIAGFPLHWSKVRILKGFWIQCDSAYPFQAQHFFGLEPQKVHQTVCYYYLSSKKATLFKEATSVFFHV